jgi:hypothetical protein
MEYGKELKIGSEDDMLAHAEKHNEKTLTLKSLEKKFNEFIKEMQGQIEFLNRKIETIKKSLKR